MNSDIYSTGGKKTGKASLPKEVFGAQVNEALLAQAVNVYLSNQRQSPAKTKRRGEISFSKHKIWKQKGTGRARHGARSAPIFVKGGKAHGPTGEQNYKMGFNQLKRKKALASALSDKFKDKQVAVLEGLQKIKPKTKEMEKAIKGFKNAQGKISVVLPEVWTNVIRAGSNIPYLQFLQVKQLNAYEILNGGFLVFTKESLSLLKK